MSRTCGRCLVEFPGIDGRLLAFCKQDGFFVCGRCVKECRRNHGTSIKSMGFPAIIPALMVLFLFASVAPSGVALAYEYSTLNSWHAMAVPPIGSAQVGQVIKISMTITSESSYTYPVALSGQEVIGLGCTWVWDESARFIVSDATGAIWVTVNRYWEIADGSHPNPYRTCAISESQYDVGDPVVVSGNIVSSAAGATFLQAFIVSPDLVHPTPNVLGWVIVIPILALCVGLWARTWVVGHRRLVLHNRALEGKASLPLPSYPTEKDLGLPWQQTYRGSGLLDRPSYVVLFAAVPWSLPAVLTWLAGSHSQNQYYIAAILAALSAIVSTTVLFMALVSRVKSSAMAVTEAGVYLWYGRPADRYELDPIIPWSDVAGVRIGVVGKTQALILDLAAGGRKSFPGLNRQVRDAILKTWNDRAMISSTTEN